MTKALLVIDPQKDYLPEGTFPLWQVEKTVAHILEAIDKANNNNIPVIILQHVADPSVGIAPFFNEGTTGVEIIDSIKEKVPAENVVIKHYADGFYQTQLAQVLNSYNVDSIDVCGMMTQNCVTHTAISKDAENYNVHIISECCTTVNEAIHLIGLNAVSTRVSFAKIEDL